MVMRRSNKGGTTVFSSLTGEEAFLFCHIKVVQKVIF